MKFEILPCQGAGPVRFGMHPEAARAALGVAFTSFKRTPDSEYPCDSFIEAGCFIYYDAQGRAEAVELAEPAQAMFEGVDLLGVAFDDLTLQLITRDPELQVDVDGFTSRRFGIGCWAPSAGETPEIPPESVIVFKSGYYD